MVSRKAAATLDRWVAVMAIISSSESIFALNRTACCSDWVVCEVVLDDGELVSDLEIVSYFCVIRFGTHRLEAET